MDGHRRVQQSLIVNAIVKGQFLEGALSPAGKLRSHPGGEIGRRGLRRDEEYATVSKIECGPSLGLPLASKARRIAAPA